MPKRTTSDADCCWLSSMFFRSVCGPCPTFARTNPAVPAASPRSTMILLQVNTALHRRSKDVGVRAETQLGREQVLQLLPFRRLEG